jgi:hypothetical protein
MSAFAEDQPVARGKPRAAKKSLLSSMNAGEPRRPLKG